MPTKGNHQVTMYYADGDEHWQEVKDITEEEMQTVMEYLETSSEWRRVHHGHWVDSDPNTPDASHKKNGMSYYCSVCGHRAGKYKHKTYRFCPWCGARMTEESNETLY